MLRAALSFQLTELTQGRAHHSLNVLGAVLHLGDDLRVQWPVVAEALGAPCCRCLAQLWTLHLGLERGVAGD